MNPIRRLVPWRRRPKTIGNAPGYKIAVVALTSDDQAKLVLSQFAVRGKWELAFASTSEEALAQLKTGQPAVILCDRDTEDLDWRRFVEGVAANRRECTTILASHTYDKNLWDEVIQRGGYDILAKPLQEEQTLGAVNLAWLYAKGGWRESTL